VRFYSGTEQLTLLADPDGGISRRLYALDTTTGETEEVFLPTITDDEDLPLEEKLRRERLRERGRGVTRYSTSKAGNLLMIPLGTDCWVQDGLAGAPRLIASDAVNPAFSPDSRQVAFVRRGEVHVVSSDGGEAVAVTSGEAGTTRGLAEYIAQEEMSRMEGFWWSPDSASIAFVEVDERHIPPFRIIHQGKERPQWEEHAYPFAGAKNARVRLGVVPATGGEPVWMELSVQGESEDIYLARVRWTRDGTLWAELQDRRQQRLELVRFDLQTGSRTVVLTETTDVWINLHNLFRELPDGTFLWGSERTGFMHLYQYSRDGELLRSLSDGPWMVESIAAYDADRKEVYVTGTRDSPLERHLYALPLQGGTPRKVTNTPGMHLVKVSIRRRQFIDRSSGLSEQPSITLRDLDSGDIIRTIHQADDPRAAGLAPPELLTVTTRDGETLHGALYTPEGDGPFPLLVWVYGGPHAQRVQRTWSMTADLRAQNLRSEGFAILKLDNRGSARRGLAFEGALRWDMGNIEVQDQVDGVRAMVDRGVADPDRVGILGWSYGGYMSLMCLAQAPETFHAASAGAPVTHWDTYDTHYTERYMGLPQENPEGYARSAVMAHVDNIRGELQLIHGMVDENVLFRNSARLINALNRAQKRYELLLFPDERHMPRNTRDLIYTQERIRDFFTSALR
jgi:dipeptidyl-peptidase-4